MKRREFVEKAGLGAAALVTLANPGRARAASNPSPQHNHRPISGPLATATVSFGAWASGINRRPNIVAAAGLPNNVHALIPHEVTIKAGGTVNYIIAGFHVIAVYGDGTEPGDINVGITVPPTNAPAPPIIDDPANRVYRGIDPTVLPLLQGPMQQGPIGPPFQPLLQDRVEVVHFPDPGTFLVICAVLPHFNEGMYGFVKVNP
jgi:plastocyanin